MSTSPTTAHATTIDRLANWLAFYLAGLFLAYCLIYLCACPSPQLALAIFAELLAVVVSLAILRAGLFKLPAAALSRLPPSLQAALTAWRRTASWLKATLFAAMALATSVDFCALTLSVAGAGAQSAALYCAMPVTSWVGLHPAFSLEMLAGALVQSQNYQKAEPLYHTLISIRTTVCGRNSDQVGAIYADMGDFCVRKHDLPSAQIWYRRSLSLGTHTGRACTGLATTLREQGKFAESQQYYLQALQVRKALYGMHSRQYNDTLRGYTRLQQLMSYKHKGTR
jgi:tetratricopeptide (TPR) repeat protein